MQTAVARHADLDLDAVRPVFDDARGPGRRRRWTREGFAAASSTLRAHRRPALLRPGVRGAGAGPRRARSTPRSRTRSPSAFHAAHRAALRLRLPRRPAPAGRVGQPAGHRDRPDPPARAARARAAATAAPSRAATGVRAACSSTTAVETRRRLLAPGPARPATRSPARRSSRSSARPCRCTPASPPRVDAFGNLLVTRSRSDSADCPRHRARQPADTAVARRPGPRRDRRRARWPRREGGRDRHRAHVALADDPRRARLPRRHPRPAAAQADRPLVLGAGAPGRARLPDRDDAPGDVFFHNDVYLSEGGIGHLPDLCVTVPVFAHDGAEVVAFVQAFGHHDDIGGAVPGSMPSSATHACSRRA